MAIRIDILTLFPEMFGPVLGTSIPKRAAEKGLVSYHLTNIRDFATDAHKSVDDKPFGGGPGIDGLRPMELSIGDYVVSGGELAAMVVIDSVGRLLPGALGAETGAADE